MTQEFAEPEQVQPRFGRGAALRARLHDKIFLIPSFVTVIAFFAGFLGAMASIRGDFEYATKCIALAILFDGLDGRVARKLNATSAFGREFDSLSDLVAFGVAPALTVYFWAFKPNFDDFGVLVAFMFVVCGAARLARFNITTTAEPKKHFDGLPIPGGAAALCAVVYWHPAPLEPFSAAVLAAIYMVIVSALMVSTISFFSVKHIRLTQKDVRLTIFVIAVIVAACWYSSRLSILIGTTAYVLSGPAFAVLRKKPPQVKKEAPPVKEANA